MARRWLHGMPAALAVLLACGPAPRRDTRAGGSAPETHAPAIQVPSGELFAVVDQMSMAHRIAPEESLAVHLSGTIGPDGSYVLTALDVERSPGRVRILPRVARRAGDAFISMVMPLDHTLRLQLPRGRYVVEAGPVADSVEVAPGALRPAPEVSIESQPPVAAGDAAVVPLVLETRAGDGFVDRIEVREITAAGVSAPRPPDSLQRDGDVLRAWTTIRRPPGDARRSVEVRAIDGQGDAGTARLVLDPR